jgi:3-hydroxy acid dehydrogenase/malonic semialdehyde reductase
MKQSRTEKPVAIVTGASSGIGEAICRLLTRQNFKIIAIARNQSKLDQLKSELGEDCLSLALDITDAEAVASLEQQLPANFKNIEVLINNAGHDVGGRQRFDQGSADQWCDIIETNVQGTIRMTRAVIDGMLDRGKGHIVNMGSIAGVKPYATGTAYVSSKYAIHGFSETLRLDYAGLGIRVTEILPGLVRTGFARQRLGDAKTADQFYDSYEVHLQPQDVADTVLYALQTPAHVEIAQLVVLPVSAKA